VRRRIFTIAVFIFCALSVPLYAHVVEITVVDADLRIPLEGASVRNYDGAEYVCDSNGKVVLNIPDERPVVIQVAYPGYTSGRLTVSSRNSAVTLELRLSGVLESRELVVEAAKPEANESRIGQSVAVSGREIAQTAEIGIIEDVMSTIKLLPGVGYTGLFNAQPSIRGGTPGDMCAVLDGFYIGNPYHWGGGFSIFDPKMIQSARLSHGVFSSRYGHTISGLLELSSKKPSPSETEFELGLNTSAANFNLSLPLAGKGGAGKGDSAKGGAARGGVLFMGRITYYDPVVLAAQQLSKVIEILQIINSVSVAPYIRSATVTTDYRLADNLEFKASGFWGMDGVGAVYDTGELKSDGYTSRTNIDFSWTNYQGFLSTSLAWNPRNDMLLKFALGTGYEDSVVAGDMRNRITGKVFERTDANKQYYDLIAGLSGFTGQYDFSPQNRIDQSELTFNAQGRIDYDWEVGAGFIVAAGAQELFSKNSTRGIQQVQSEKMLWRMDPSDQEAIFAELGVGTDPSDIVIRNFLKQYMIVSFPLDYPPDAGNSLFSTSGYVLGEYSSPNKRVGGELGLRLDHYYLLGNGFTLQSKPALNPRLTVNVNFPGTGDFIESLDISAGTGLFASMSDSVFIAEKQYNINEIKPGRSWTSVLGIKLQFPFEISVSVEGYYKYIFDRMYVPITVNADSLDVRPYFNGEGRAWGIDLMIQKTQSRFVDGWISYSFNWTKYRDPDAGNSDMGISGGIYGTDWYFPSYHRFHNLNLILNFKPAPRFNIYTRFGVATGVVLSKRVGSGPLSYPVYAYDPTDPAGSYFIEKFYWPSQRDESNRTTASLPFDIKFSILGYSNSGKTRYEVYAAVENILALVYSAEGNTSFNQYTGKEEPGSAAASYEIPIPIPSFGVKISY